MAGNDPKHTSPISPNDLEDHGHSNRKKGPHGFDGKH
jgi:hypothetical protein